MQARRILAPFAAAAVLLPVLALAQAAGNGAAPGTAAPAGATSAPTTGSATGPTTGPATGSTTNSTTGTAPGPVPGVASNPGANATSDPMPPGGATVSLDGALRRGSLLLGAIVHGSDNELLGKVEEILFSPAGGAEPVAVIAVGVVPGTRDKLVAVPVGQLQHSERWVLPGATRGTLRERPDFSLDAAPR